MLHHVLRATSAPYHTSLQSIPTRCRPYLALYTVKPLQGKSQLGQFEQNHHNSHPHLHLLKKTSHSPMDILIPLFLGRPSPTLPRLVIVCPPTHKTLLPDSNPHS